MNERRCYRIEVYTPHDTMAQVDYYSTCHRANLREFANDQVDLVAWREGSRLYWESDRKKSEIEFIDEYSKGCGHRIFDISVEEFKSASHATFDVE